MEKNINKKKPRICMVCPYSYPLFNPDSMMIFGGWEVRMSLIAKELARRGNFEVFVIVADVGQPHIEKYEAVTLISWKENSLWDVSIPENKFPVPIPSLSENSISFNEGMVSESKKKLNIRQYFFRIYLYILKIIKKSDRIYFYVRKTRAYIGAVFHSLKICYRSFKDIHETIAYIETHPIIKRNIAVLKEIDADIYVVPGNHTTSAEVAYFCDKHHKKYVFLAGSNEDYKRNFRLEPRGYDIYGDPNFLKVYAIEHADIHLLQNENQADMLKTYNRNGMIIRNPIDLTHLYPEENANLILWVGHSDPRVKRPNIVLDLAEKLSNYSFCIIMKKANEIYFAECIERAESLPNVTLIDYVPFNEIEKYYANAKILVNTSLFEGFPNAFLQAAKYGKPIITINVDPGYMFSQHGCGISCGGNFKFFEESVRRLLTDDALYTKMSTAALHYVHTYHDKDIIIPQYEKAFQHLLRS